MNIYNLIILDASGSMDPLIKPSVDGVNETIQTIRAAKKKDPANEQFIGLFAFSSCYPGITQPIIQLQSIENVKEIKYEDYQPEGCTPLYDAIGKIVSIYKETMKPEDKALVTIITDGYENSSVHYNAQMIHQLITSLREKGWIFSYIGANQDSLLESQKIGIDNALDFLADEDSTREMWQKELHCRTQFFDLLHEKGNCKTQEEADKVEKALHILQSKYFKQ